jgi:hypothetical protein
MTTPDVSVSQQALEIGELRARIEWTPADDGSWPSDRRELVIERADPQIYVSEVFLEQLDPRFAHYGDGILTIHGHDGDVSYGLSHRDPFRRQYLGTRCA